MSILEFKKNKENYEINTFDNAKVEYVPRIISGSKKGNFSNYRVVVNRDPKQLAQILIDLHLDGFKIEEAIKIFLNRVSNKDWLGF